MPAGEADVCYTVITERGINALRRAWPVYARGISQYFTRWLTPQEAELMEVALQRIYQAAQQKENTDKQ
jgi:hypothetical protein